MKKLSSVWKKYINHVSVMVTVFSVLMMASFYNPASLAVEKSPLSFSVNNYKIGRAHV